MIWLEKVKEQLDKLEAPTIQELKNALLQCRSTVQDVDSYVTDPEEGREYGRKVLYRTPVVEAILISLPAKAKTAIHNHGESVGCAYIVEGSVQNVIYESAGFGMAKPAASLEQPAGSSMLAPYGQIHQMRNEGSSRALSLHFYAPPLSKVRQFVQEDQATLDFVI